MTWRTLLLKADDLAAQPQPEERELTEAGSALQLPSSAAFGPDHVLRQIGIVGFHAGTIPGEFLTRTNRDVPQKQCLGDHTLEFEIAARFYFATLAGIDPFALVAGGTG